MKSFELADPCLVDEETIPQPSWWDSSLPDWKTLGPFEQNLALKCHQRALETIWSSTWSDPF